MIRSCIVPSLALAVALSGAALAQTPDDPENAVQVGDHWTYVTKDELPEISVTGAQQPSPK